MIHIFVISDVAVKATREMLEAVPVQFASQEYNIKHFPQNFAKEETLSIITVKQYHPSKIRPAVFQKSIFNTAQSKKIQNISDYAKFITSSISRQLLRFAEDFAQNSFCETKLAFSSHFSTDSEPQKFNTMHEQLQTLHDKRNSFQEGVLPVIQITNWG